jgi:hypothetical protein
MNADGTAQVTLILGGLLRQNVTLEGLTTLNGTARTHAKALLGTALGFHLRHEKLRVFNMITGVTPKSRPL